MNKKDKFNHIESIGPMTLKVVRIPDPRSKPIETTSPKIVNEVKELFEIMSLLSHSNK